MTSKEIVIGGFYKGKINNSIVTVKVLSGTGPYRVLNTETGRETTFRTAAKFRRKALDPAKERELLASTEKAIDRAVNEAEARGVFEELEGEKRSDPTAAGSAAGVSALQTSTQASAPAPASGLISKLRQPNGDNAPHLIIEARAGTGKTTTLLEGLKRIYGLPSHLTPSPQQAAVWEAMQLSSRPRFACFAAFNNSIAKELERKIPQGVGLAAKTLHSLGFYAIKKAFRIDPNRMEYAGGRVHEIISEILNIDLRVLRKEKATLLKATKELVSKCKQNLIGRLEDMPKPPGCSADLAEYYDNMASWKNNSVSKGAERFREVEQNFIREKLEETVRRYDIDLGNYRDQVFDLVPRVLERCKDVARDGYVDFDDMIWIPVVLKLNVLKNGILLIDEAQDMNRCQHALAKMAGDRLILCGDPKQSIYGFAGADSDSMNRMETELKATERGCVRLPLTVTRRCGKSIVREAQRLVPDFEAFPSNGEGTVSGAKYPQQKRGKETIELPVAETYIPLVKDGDMVLCRANAPLVTQCFKFLGMQRRASIQGRNVGDSLIALVESLEATATPELISRLADWLVKETAKENAQRMPSETRLQGMQDRHDCVMAFAKVSDSVEGLKVKIQSLFTDDKDAPGVKFSSIHRAKGLEAHRVFYILGFGRPADKLKDWELDQERNLEYVAITRAIEELVYVS